MTENSYLGTIYDLATINMSHITVIKSIESLLIKKT